MLTEDDAIAILYEMTESESLRTHALTVAASMKALAGKFGEDENQFVVTGLLHDADYEKHSEKHPDVIVSKLRKMGEEEIAHAIAGHYTKWNVSRTSMLDKCIVAADELTGFIIASSKVRPTGLEGLTAKSVIKKLKTNTFAAKVDREEVQKGADLIGMDLRDLISLIIYQLNEERDRLKLHNPQ